MWTRRVKRGARGPVGAVTPLNYRGRNILKIDSRQYFCNRLVWLYVHGSWPDGVVDHINGDTRDDCIGNLRDVSASLNMQNKRKAHRTNQSGMLGVKTHSSGYQARISVDGHCRHLGTFDTAEQAHAVYLAAKRELHPGCTI